MLERYIYTQVEILGETRRAREREKTEVRRPLEQSRKESEGEYISLEHQAGKERRKSCKWAYGSLTYMLIATYDERMRMRGEHDVTRRASERGTTPNMRQKLKESAARGDAEEPTG